MCVHSVSDLLCQPEQACSFLVTAATIVKRAENAYSHTDLDMLRGNP